MACHRIQVHNDNRHSERTPVYSGDPLRDKRDLTRGQGVTGATTQRARSSGASAARARTYVSNWCHSRPSPTF